MDKPLQYLSLARKGGRLELGEEPVGAITRAGKAALVLVAQDAGDHTWRRALSFVSGTEQSCLRVPYTRDEVGLAVGRTSLAIGAFTDPALALAFVKALPQTQWTAPVVEVLENRVKKQKMLHSQQKVHQSKKKK